MPNVKFVRNVLSSLSLEKKGLVFGVENPKEKGEQSEENADLQRNRKQRSLNPRRTSRKEKLKYFWEIYYFEGDDEPTLLGPITRSEVFKWLDKTGIGVPYAIRRLRNVR